MINTRRLKNVVVFIQTTSVLLSTVTVISPVTKINASENSRRHDLILSVSDLIEFYRLYLSFAVWLPRTYHFLEPILLCFHIIWILWKINVFSSDFSMMKNIIAPSFFSSFVSNKFQVLHQSVIIRFICLNLLQSVYNNLENIHNSINYQLCNHYFYSFQ